MSRHRPVLRLPILLLALLLLLAPAAAQARAGRHAGHKRSACPASRSARASARGKRRAGACRSRLRRNRRGVRVLHRLAGEHGAQQAALGAVVAVPTCDDGSAPAAQGCTDGSQATNCPDGSTLEEQGGSRVCRATPAPAGPDEFSCEADTAGCSAVTAVPNCENGRDAVATAGGWYTCADGSEPACEEAFTPVFTEGRLVACEPGSEDEEEESDG